MLWNWSNAQQRAFDNIKNKIAHCTTILFYDSLRELTLQNDASEHGIGSVIMQDGKPIAFASRRLSPLERNAGYSVWFCQILSICLWPGSNSGNGPSTACE